MRSATSCTPNAYWRKLATIRLVGARRRVSHGFGMTDPHGTDLLVACHRAGAACGGPRSLILASERSDGPRVLEAEQI